MLRFLKAFASLRWRILMNSIERHGGRDALERLSIASGQLIPIFVALVMIPSAFGLAAAGVYAGSSLAAGTERTITLDVLRSILLAVTASAVLGPLVLPAGDRTSAVRLLLLPIPRRVLYLAQAGSTLADPWMLPAAAVVIGIPLGLALGGAPVAAAAAAAAGALLVVALIGISLAVTNAVHLAVRDRRRGEILMLLLVIVLPVMGLLPGLLDGERRQRARAGVREGREQTERAAGPNAVNLPVPRMAPSEMYVAATRASAAGRHAEGGRSLAGLAIAATLLHLAAFAAFSGMLRTPGTTGTRRAAWSGGHAMRLLPGLSAGTSGIALNQLRLSVRTPRGRATLLSPLVVFAMFAVMMLRSGSGMEFGPIRLSSGVGLASFSAWISLLSILPFAMNQFAIDGAGLTLVLLAPVDTRTLLGGKTLGNGLVAAVPVSLCIAGAILLFPHGSPAVWICVPLAMIATYLLVAPAAALLSAVFPRRVDLNSIGRGSNAHGAAGLLGTLCFFVAGAPNALLVLLATSVLNRPLLAPIFVTLWALVCAAAHLVLLRAVVPVFERRRENLAIVASGR